MIETGLAAGLIGLILGLIAWLVNRRVARAAGWAVGWRAAGRGAAAVMAALALPPIALGLWIAGCLALGQPAGEARRLGPGVSYRRIVGTSPRPYVVHVLEIERDRVGRIAVPAPTGGDGPLGPMSRAAVPTAALTALGADVGINSSYFTPCRETHPLSYAPHAGEAATVIGPAFGGGRRHGWTEPGVEWVPLWHAPGRRLGIGRPVPEDADASVSAPGWLVRGGRNAVPMRPRRVPAFDPNDSKPYPRTAVGLDASGRRMWLVVVDGKQPRYSMGLTLSELADRLIALGVSDAVALDGGGSSTLVARDPASPGGGLVVLNRPCHTKVPGRQRPVASVLGIVLERGR